METMRIATRLEPLIIVDPAFEATIRRQVLDQANRNVARRSSLPYVRSLKASLTLANRPDPIIIEAIRWEFARLNNLMLTNSVRSSSESEKPSA